MGLMRSHRLSAVVDGAEHPCRAQGACVRHCNMLDNWRADGEHACTYRLCHPNVLTMKTAEPRD